jgi:hypothetical protein
MTSSPSPEADRFLQRLRHAVNAERARTGLEEIAARASRRPWRRWPTGPYLARLQASIMFAFILLGAVLLRAVGPDTVGLPDLGALDPFHHDSGAQSGIRPSGLLWVEIEAVSARDLRVEASGSVDTSFYGAGSLWLVAVQRQVGNSYVGPVYLARTPVRPAPSGEFSHLLTMRLRHGLDGDECDFLLVWAKSAEAVAWLEDNQTGRLHPKWDGRWGPLHPDLLIVAKTTARVPTAG